MVRALAVLVFESGRPAPCAAPGAVLLRLRARAKAVLAFRAYAPYHIHGHALVVLPRVRDQDVPGGPGFPPVPSVCED